jgi:hypothetical protein
MLGALGRKLYIPVPTGDETKEDRAMAAKLGEAMYHDMLSYLFGVRSAKDLTQGQAVATLNWITGLEMNQVKFESDVIPEAAQEAELVYEAGVEQSAQNASDDEIPF